MTGLIKAGIFGGGDRHRLLPSRLQQHAGAEGVGRAATRAFVLSFMLILVLDFFLALLLTPSLEAYLPVRFRERCNDMVSRPPPPTATALPIQLQQVTMQFGGQRVLHAIDLGHSARTNVAVIGESGCGKTVLLKLIIGLLRPTVGRVLFDGKGLDDLKEKELSKATAALRLSVPGGGPVR